MKYVTDLFLVAFLASVSSAAWADTARASLKDLQNKDVGSVELVETPSGAVIVKLAVSGLPAGSHAFHIHDKGACDAATKFDSAGPHLAGGKTHGVLSDNGPHPGDLPNVEVGKDGTAKVEVFVGGTAKTGWLAAMNVLDADGAAIVLHAKADDYATQPSGAAGDRIACGVLGK